MKNKEIFKILTNQYLKNIANITNDYTNALHLIYRENDFSDEPDLKGFFGILEEKCARYSSYISDSDGYYFHEEDIFLEAKKTKENYDTYR